MKTILYTFAICTVLIFQGCVSNDKKSNDKIDPAKTLNKNHLLEATGTIISVPPGKRNFIVKHNRISGFMDAMTMPFPVSDSTVLSGIATKDSVRFMIDTTGSSIRVTSIQKIE